MRIAFMGTPDFAVPALKSLIASNHDVVCVYSQPPRPKGRGQMVQESPVHGAAKAAGIPVRTPPNFKNDQDAAEFTALELDVAVVAAYGLILPKMILESPRFGCINIHASLLPRWRGAAPIQRAILEGDDQTGITIMQMDEGLDTGDMIAVKSFPIRATTTTQSLHDMLSVLGGPMIVDVLDELEKNGRVTKTRQPDAGMTYAKMLKKNEGAIDWTKDAAAIDRQIRALHPWPGTWTHSQKGRLKILSASLSISSQNQRAGTVMPDGIVLCGHNTALKLEIVQPDNKKPMTVLEALRGGYMSVGEILS